MEARISISEMESFPLLFYMIRQSIFWKRQVATAMDRLCEDCC